MGRLRSPPAREEDVVCKLITSQKKETAMERYIAAIMLAMWKAEEKYASKKVHVPESC